jgi:glycosyltransferase involved in cell wall biosynthesis
MEKITFCIPSKNNCRYLKACIPSIRKNAHRKDHDIIVFVDADEDGTVEWLESVRDKYNIEFIVNGSDELYGIGRAYDKCVEESTTDIFMIFHADMMLGKDADLEAFKYLDRKKVVCATRIEPPLHPENGEKIIKDFGMWPEPDVEEGWLEEDFDKYVEEAKLEFKDKTTNGCFAPWMMYKKDFVSIGGHDPRFASAREDSDVFNRLVLGGFELIQSWQSFVYHLTARGGQFQHGKLTKEHSQKSEEWQKLMNNSTREFFRKWGTNVQHNNLMMPIVSPKYDIGFVVHNIHNYDILYSLEPWCSTFYGDFPKDMQMMYTRDEQPNTTRNLLERIKDIGVKKNNDILVEFDSVKLTNESFNILVQLPHILSNDEQLEVGEFELGIFKIKINKIKTYEEELIVNENTMFDAN